MKLIKIQSAVYKVTEKQFKEILKRDSGEVEVEFYGTSYFGHRMLMEYIETIKDDLVFVGELDMELNK